MLLKDYNMEDIPSGLSKKVSSARISLNELKHRGRILTGSFTGIVGGICLSLCSLVIAEKNVSENPHSKDSEPVLYDSWNREHFTFYSDSGRIGIYGGIALSGLSLLTGVIARNSWKERNRGYH